jgi:hypothetical protein
MRRALLGAKWHLLKRITIIKTTDSSSRARPGIQITAYSQPHWIPAQGRDDEVLGLSKCHLGLTPYFDPVFSVFRFLCCRTPGILTTGYLRSIRLSDRTCSEGACPCECLSLRMRLRMRNEGAPLKH